MTEIKGSTTLVASSRPPIPTSSTAISTATLAKYSKAMAVSISKKLGCHGNFCRRNRSWAADSTRCVDLAELHIGNRLVIHANAFVDAYQVRRTVEPGLVAGSAQDGRQGRSRRAFAVGAGDQHAGEAALGIAQRRQQFAHIRQIELVRRRRGKLVSKRVELLNACSRTSWPEISDYNRAGKASAKDW